MPKRKILLIILIIFNLLLFGSYFYKIDSVPFVRLDDGNLMEISETFATTGQLGSQMSETGHNESRFYHVHPPFYYLVNGIVFKIFGSGILQSRLIPLCSAIIVIFLTFLLFIYLSRLKLTIMNTLVLSALFLSTPIFFILARSNRPEMFALALILSALLAYNYFEKQRKIIWLIISGLFCGLAMITQAYSLFIFLYIVLSIFINKQQLWQQIISFTVACSIPVVAYLFWIIQDFQSFYYQMFVLRQASTTLIIPNIIIRYIHFFSSFETWNITGFLLALGLIIFISKKNKLQIGLNPQLLLIICFLATFLIIPVLNKYYMVILLPPIFLYFLERLKKKPNVWLLILLVAYLGINSIGLAVYWQKYHNFDYPTYAEKIKQHLPTPGNFGVLGSPSLYPGLNDYEFYAYINPSIIHHQQTYSNFKERLKELKIKYIIQQEYEGKDYGNLDYFNRFLKQDCQIIAEVNDPFYGSEGVKKDNLIKIYSVRP
ncbi:MAG: glycosyltransferase family 39 protein, partial [Candidatus Margulisbacteria bacterium]|nr:glycosyltransferase family 39 protein [Candidatus Margulisiibacteriota bacterium]